MAKLRIGSTDYTLTSNKVSSPALKLNKGGVISYGFLTTTKPATKTLKVGASHYLNQPKIPFTITLPVSLSASAGSTVYSAYLSQLNVYGATWSFSGVGQPSPKASPGPPHAQRAGGHHALSGEGQNTKTNCTMQLALYKQVAPAPTPSTVPRPYSSPRCEHRLARPHRALGSDNPAGCDSHQSPP